MNKKGFTLIELLAVIVVLAIIALIATPVVMNTIADAKNEANERSLEKYATQLELGYANAMLNAENDTDAEKQAAAKTYADGNINGTVPTIAEGKLTWEANKGVVSQIEATIDTGTYCYKAKEGASTGACK